MKNFNLIFFTLLFSTAINANNLLPPAMPWSGATQDYIVADDDPWVTPTELADFNETPSYQQTRDWLEKFAKQYPQIKLTDIGVSHQGRPIMMAIVSSDKSIDKIKSNGKPTLLIHSGIHSGEIDGKDAGLMWLRHVFRNQPKLIEKFNLLFIPVLNVDGHENNRAINRVNQRGPNKMGWRTNARNQNLNRDFAKLDTPGVNALVKVINEWPIDLYLDMHVTDGADYQYDITYGYNTYNHYSPNIIKWLEKSYRPIVDKTLNQRGHIAGDLVFALDGTNFSKGLSHFTASQRYSNGYGDTRHLPTVLVENHSLKPYKQRVLGSVELYSATTNALIKNVKSLRAAVAKDKAARPQSVVVSFKNSKKPFTKDFKGIEYERYDSPITGRKEARWLAKPKDYKLPVYRKVADKSVKVPTAYWIPASYPEVIKRLKQHGVKLEVITKPRTVKIQQSKFINPKVASRAFEGRAMLSFEDIEKTTVNKTYQTGSARVSTDQDLRSLIVILLEPESGDSFVRWGFFNEILQRTEYMEGYVVEPLAKKMLAEDPKLKAEFEKALKDPKFANSPYRRLSWFYQRSPYYDPAHNVYPVGVEVE